MAADLPLPLRQAALAKEAIAIAGTEPGRGSMLCAQIMMGDGVFDDRAAYALTATLLECIHTEHHPRPIKAPTIGRNGRMAVEGALLVACMGFWISSGAPALALEVWHSAASDDVKCAGAGWCYGWLVELERDRAMANNREAN